MKEWLIGLTCAAMLAAVARCIMPPGPVRQVGSLVCAMMLLWATLRPLGAAFAWIGGYRAATQTWHVEEELEQKEEQLLKSLIEQECGTYIVDKAAGLGAECHVSLACEMGEAGIWMPVSCRVIGQLTAQQRSQLEQIISMDLGIALERQEYAGGV